MVQLANRLCEHERNVGDKEQETIGEFTNNGKVVTLREVLDNSSN